LRTVSIPSRGPDERPQECAHHPWRRLLAARRVAARGRVTKVASDSCVSEQTVRKWVRRWSARKISVVTPLRAFGRIVRAQVFPIGIDAAAVSRQAAVADASRHMQRLRQSLGNRTLMIGVDRLDYSKRSLARFAAFEQLLKAYPETHRRIVFMETAPPSRSEVPEYREIRPLLAASAGNINGRYSELDWTPRRYINKSFGHRILTGFFRGARIGPVTPLRDGMNLVAKE
jgi:trehalose-6-phosphate synthase